jgi:tRNA nucleotidyltransferase (CCA-adding enzyme)
MGALNLADEIERLPTGLLESLRLSGCLAEEQGERLFLVGGAVRDLLMGRASFDLDLAVEEDAIKLAEVLAHQVSGRLVVHSRFGTARVQLAEFRLDFAATRSETYSCPGVLPKVRPDTLEADLIRRDFTINAMALDLSPARWGELVDRYGGWEDLGWRFIRILHPGSFVDDATRIMRAIRYEQRLGFSLEPATARLLRRDRKMLDGISGDRLRREIELIFIISLC